MNRILLPFFLLLIFSTAANSFNVGNAPETSLAEALADTTRPRIFCPGSQIINMAPMRCDTVVQYTVNAFDDQGQVILILLNGINSGGAFPSGATVTTWLATDLAGNTATCSFTITTFEPTTQPVCKDLKTVLLDQNCTKTVKAFDVLEGGPYGCPVHYTIEVDKTIPYGNGPWVDAVFGINDLNQQYQVRVTALLTNARCWGNVQVRDSLPPTISAQLIDVPCVLPIEQLTPIYLRDSFGISVAEPVANDACSGNMLSISFVDVQQNLPCDDTTTVSGIIRRIWSATDASGNTGTSEQIIRRNRLLSNVQIPGNKITDCDAPDLSLETNGRPFVQFLNRHYELSGASYCEFDAQHTDTIVPAACAGNYTVKRTWKIYDSCLPFSPTNPKIGVQNIAVEDHNGPMIQCPGDLILTVLDANCRAAVDLPDVLLHDNCSGLASIQAFWTDSSFSKTLSGTIQIHQDSTGVDTLGVLGTVTSFPIGSVNMLYVATDSCDNSSDCSFRLTLANMTAPVAKCDSLLLVGLPTNGYLSIPALVLDNGSTDDCSALAFKARLVTTNTCQTEALLSDTIHVCCRNSGDTLAGTLRVYDIVAPSGTVSNVYGAGHFTDCAFKIRVSGVNAPTCTAPANITVACEAFDPTLQIYGGVVAKSCAVDSVVLTNNWNNYDTLCYRGTITRTFRVFAATGQMGQCSQKIVVTNNQDYYVRFPNDVVITACDTTNIYGEPVLFGSECELMSVSYEDQRFNVVPDACYKIERTWHIFNWCTYQPNSGFVTIPNPNPNPIANHPDNLSGPVISPIQLAGDPWRSSVVKINPTDALPTNYSIFYNATANGYEYKQIIKVIDTQDPIYIGSCANTQIVQDVTNNDPLLWNASHWFDPVLVSFDLCEAPSDINATATDACIGSNVKIEYHLLLDLDGDEIRETLVKSTDLPPSNIVVYGNASGAGIPREFDFRPVPLAQKYRFAIEKVVSGRHKTAYVRFNTGLAPNIYVAPQLPYGKHKIRWFISDECGNETICERDITIRDNKPPVVVCLSPLSLNLDAVTCSVPLYATDILQYAEDNCTPAQYLKYGLRKHLTGSGFPIDANGNPVTSVSYTFSELGPQIVELWCIDKAGNASHCEATINIQNNTGGCESNPNNPPLEGNILTEQNVGVEDVDVQISWSGSIFQPPVGGNQNNFTVTDSLGYYSFGTQFNNLPIDSLFIQPYFNVAPLNGITTFDLVLISKHILGIDPLGSPYKLIAADANKSNSITTLDIVELRKLILGIYQELPNNTSWRFIDKDYDFPNPLVPFQPKFPEKTYARGLSNNFVGVKIGDVNNTVVPNATAIADDRRAGTAYFDVTTEGKETVQAGEVVELSLQATELLAAQFTLNFNGLEVLEIQPGANMTPEHFALFPEKNALCMAWEKGGNAAFTLKCRALTAGNLREMLSIDSSITAAEAYKSEHQSIQRYAPALRFPALKTFELFQNNPNPFEGRTNIAFNLPQASEAMLKVFDANGRVLFVQTAYYERGTHSVTLEKSVLDGKGVLYYQLETPMHSATRKMVKL